MTYFLSAALGAFIFASPLLLTYWWMRLSDARRVLRSLERVLDES